MATKEQNKSVAINLSKVKKSYQPMARNIDAFLLLLSSGGEMDTCGIIQQNDSNTKIVSPKLGQVSANSLHAVHTRAFKTV